MGQARNSHASERASQHAGRWVSWGDCVIFLDTFNPTTRVYFLGRTSIFGETLCYGEVSFTDVR